MPKQARSRFWTPGCEAALAINATPVNHNKPVTLRAHKPKPAKQYLKNARMFPSMK